MTPPAATSKVRINSMAVRSLYLGLLASFPFFLFLIFVAPDMYEAHKPVVVVTSPPPPNAEADARSALTSLTSINEAECWYASRYPERGYSATLAQLGPASERGRTPRSAEGANFINGELAAGHSLGYSITYVAGPKGKHGLTSTYTVRAEPIWPNAPSFFMDQTGAIHFEKGRPAGPDSPPANLGVHLRSEQEHNAWTAWSGLREFNHAQATYASMNPTLGYAATLTELRAVGYFFPVNEGYCFTYVPGRANEAGLITTYTVRAKPLRPDLGDRSFFTDETRVIRYEQGKPAGPNSAKAE